MILFAAVVGFSSCVESGGNEIDITLMSTEVAYASVRNMNQSPDKYVGKTIKITGSFSSSVNEDLGKYYTMVGVYDNTVCCQEYVEFVLAEKLVYPSGYPQQGDKITIVGVFETYTEGNTIYGHLVNAQMTVDG